MASYINRMETLKETKPEWKSLPCHVFAEDQKLARLRMVKLNMYVGSVRGGGGGAGGLRIDQLHNYCLG